LRRPAVHRRESAVRRKAMVRAAANRDHAPAMKEDAILTVTSLLAVLLFTFHVADDIVRGIEPGNLSNLPAVPIFAVWLYGTLVLAGRRSGYVIMLLGSLLSLAVPILHMRGKGLGVAGRIATSDGALFFIWTVIAIGVAALLSVVLSARGLWRTR
jgi:hypothetical protein